MKDLYNNIINVWKFNIDFILRAHILNPLWYNREKRRFRRLEMTNRCVKRYLSRYNEYLKSLTPSIPRDTTMESTRVFSIWFQGESNAPESVKACFDSMRMHLGYELIVVDEKSLSDWITLPDYIIQKWKSGKIGMAHFSDICRVELLFQHGGLWFDATDFVTSAVPKEIMESDFFVFMAGKKIKSWYGYIQNCFIRAKKGDILIGLWRDAIYEYWKHENKIINYYGHQILFQILTETNKIAKERFAMMLRMDQDPTHILWYQHKNDPYVKELYEKWTSPTFFQKTDFKNQYARNPLPGTVAAHIFSSNKP